MKNLKLPNSDPVVLHDGSIVSADFYQRNKAAAEAGIPKLKADQKRTFRQICGKAHWLTLDKGEVSLAGLCGLTMALRYELQLIPAGKTAKNAQLYLPSR